MHRTRLNRKLAKRLDAIIDLPLARFRTAITRLTPDELHLLSDRIDLLQVKHRWTLGSHGIDRHRAPIELALLERRHGAVRRQIERGPAPVQLLLVEAAGAPRELPVPIWDEQAA